MHTTILLYVAILLATGLLFGKVSKKLKLPNVTGYLVGGLLLGPSLLHIIPMGVIEELGIISSVALAFIAFSIGTEMKIVYFKRVGATPIWIAICEATFAVLVTLIAILGYFFIKGDLSLANFRFALVLSAIAAATAPAATIMVVRQYKAKGKLTETLLSVVAIDDSVAIILFGLFVALANALGQESQGKLWLSILNPLIEVVSSLGIGFVLGIVLTLGCKWFTGRGNRISLAITLLFLSVFLANLLHASPLLTAMMLGATFGNTSSKVDDLNGLLYFITPPIFTLFFVLSGAELNLNVLGVVGILGIIYVFFRVVGKIFGAWFGAKVTKADPVIAKYLGYTLIPQAGVAIGLSLIATQVLNPDMGSQIRAIILAGTLIYELTGPLITKITLKKAKEIAIEA